MCFDLRRLISISAVSLLLTGCGHVLRPLNEQVLARDESFAPAQKFANVQGAVLSDEDYMGARLINGEATGGVGTHIRRYRRVIVQLINSEGGKPIMGLAGRAEILALVPDGFPKLLNGDLVEMRMLSLYDYMRDFDKTGEGTAVLRLLCPTVHSRAEVKSWQSCASHYPWHEPWGEGNRFPLGVMAASTGRPFLKSLKDHTELSFSLYYDETGAVLPSAVKPAEHPRLDGWVPPKASN